MQEQRQGVLRAGGRKLIAVLALVAVAAAATASAAMAEPKGEFKVFNQCPIGTAGLKGCVVSRTESGEIVIGNKKEAKEKTAVPIVNVQTLQGGFGESNAEGSQPFFAA